MENSDDIIYNTIDNSNILIYNRKSNFKEGYSYATTLYFLQQIFCLINI